MSENFVKVARVEEVKPGKMKRVEVRGHHILLANVDGEFYATDDKVVPVQAGIFLIASSEEADDVAAVFDATAVAQAAADAGMETLAGKAGPTRARPRMRGRGVPMASQAVRHAQRGCRRRALCARRRKRLIPVQAFLIAAASGASFPPSMWTITCSRKTLEYP
ncbi:MAG: hypothetical protein HY525_14245 [Betaproteobacteria bacterium]|nr:hypothetical protein [Betaproteobacteria bacterium]